MELEIIKIKAKGNVVLSEENKPINPFNPIWTRVGKSKKENDKPYYPTAFRINEKIPVQLEVAIRIINPIPGPCKLECIYVSKIHRNEIKVFAGDFKIAGNEDQFKEDHEVKVPVFPVQQPDGFIGMKGDFQWTITRVSINKKTAPDVTPLEIYWLYSARYNKIFRKGVPVEILRQIAHTCHIMGRIKNIQLSTIPEYPLSKTSDYQLGEIQFRDRIYRIPEDKKKWIIEMVVKSCFYRNPPRYAISLKGSSFFDGDSFELYHYLESIHDPDALCNCMDQAALLYVYLTAIGIEKVSMCYISPFGFLRLTNLVGRGLCNNPDYNELKGHAIVNEWNSDRGKFGCHYFCRINDEWIVDSCIGPHTGNENSEAYIENTVDDNYPPPKDGKDIQRPTKNDFIPWELKYINWNDTKKQILTIPLAKILLDLMGYSNESSKEKFEAFVVCNWSSALESCPVLPGWDIFFPETTAGDRSVMQTWKLRKNGGRVNIRVLVHSSEYEERAKKSFLNLLIGSIITLPDSWSHYEKGTKSLGEFSIQSISKNPHRVLFIPEIEIPGGKNKILNILYEVSCKNVTLDQDEIHDWLRDTALKNIKTTIDKYLPSLEDLECDNETPTVNEKVKFLMNTQKNVFIDFKIIEGDGLQLIEEKNQSLEFIALKESENKLLLAVVDKDTLLCSTREFNIKVKSNVKV